MRTSFSCQPIVVNCLLIASRLFRPTSIMESPPSRSYITSRLHYIFLGLIFLALASLLIVLEMSTPTPYTMGYVNGALAILSSIAIFTVAAATTKWTLAFLLAVNALTILACMTSALTSMRSREEHHMPAYWACLGVLVCSVYSAVFIMIKHGLSGRMMNEDSTEPIMSPIDIASSRQQIVQPPEGFILPSEVPYLPDYDTLSQPPTYQEAIHITNGVTTNKQSTNGD